MRSITVSFASWLAVVAVVASAPFIAAPASAAEPAAVAAVPGSVDSLARWVEGAGTIGVPGLALQASPNAMIMANTPITAGTGIVTIELAKAPASRLVLAPGTTITLRESGTSLHIEVANGKVQADIADKGPYADLHVLGAALDITVTGTLFVVERVATDQDFVSLISGKLKVVLRAEVAKLLNAADAVIELVSRQGLGANTSSGLGGVESLTGTTALLAPASRGSEGSGTGEGNGGTGDGMGDAGTGPGDDIGSQIQSDIDNSITGEVQQQVQDQVQQQVQDQVVGGNEAVLDRPPGPPL